MPGIGAWRPNNHHHSIGKKSNRLEARLAIISPRVLSGDRPAGKDQRGISKIQTSLAESGLALCRVKRDLHLIKCTPD